MILDFLYSESGLCSLSRLHTSLGAVPALLHPLSRQKIRCMEGVLAAYPAQQSSRTLVEAQVGTSDSDGNREAETGEEERSSSTSEGRNTQRKHTLESVLPSLFPPQPRLPRHQISRHQFRSENK